MLKLTKNSCLDIDMDDLFERLDSAKLDAEHQDRVFVTIVVDGANRRENETEFDALLRRLGITIEARESLDNETLALRTLLDLQGAVTEFIKSIYNLDGYYVFLEISKAIGMDIVLMMAKEQE